MKNTIKWNDIHDASQDELKKSYKINDRELEKQLRRHMDGASPGERRKLYESLYGKRK